MVVTARNWEQTFRDWSKPSSVTEAEKCDRAERMVKQAIAAYPGFRGVDIRVYAKGSYANNTNVRLDSDVDVAVELRRSIFFNADAVPGFVPALAGIWQPAPDTFAAFKRDVYAALCEKFGYANVTPGNKAFDIHEDTSRVDADVVPCWEYRAYYGPGVGQYVQGAELIADDGIAIINWPEQQKANGIAKNLATGGRYKFITRAIKRLRNEMADVGIQVAKPISSYLIECMVYNVPDSYFSNPAYVEDVRVTLAHIAVNVSEAWLEVNQIKPLFGWSQPWTKEQARGFALAAYMYCGFAE